MLQLAHILSQNILLHPFVALRRICQVNRRCSPYICVQPFSLIPFMYHRQRKQGITTLYKGLSSELLVKAISLGSETALASYTDWPRDVRSKHYVEDSVKVLALKGLSVALSTPFLCSAVIETVQSVIVVKDRPSFVDCLREGFYRLLHIRSTASSRILPIWLLVGPTVFYHVAHTALWHVTKKCLEFLQTNNLIWRGTSRRKTKPKHVRRQITNKHYSTKSIMDESTLWQQDDLTLNDTTLESSVYGKKFEEDSCQISTSIMASFLADVALLPIETVLNCLYIQGTRTIIDNCDETTVVLPVITNYDGFTDCYQSILRFEGQFGLYKGLGAIILQYSVHFILFRSLYYLLREFQSNSFCSSFNDGNAHEKIQSNAKNQYQHQTREPTMSHLGPKNDFLRYVESNRHSTPNNFASKNPFGESTDTELPRVDQSSLMNEYEEKFVTLNNSDI